MIYNKAIFELALVPVLGFKKNSNPSQTHLFKFQIPTHPNTILGF